MVFESLFHCVYPVSTAPVEFKTHPTIPQIEASYCGVVRCINEDDRLDTYTKKGVAHLVWECWTQIELLPYTNLRFKNMNFYDTSFENLEILRIEDKDRQEKERRFIDNTVKEMLLREKAFGHYRNMHEYFKEIGVSQRYIKAWEKVSVKQNKSLSV